MEMLLGIGCVCLLLILALMLWKYISLKRNIRHFSQELDKLKDSNYRQPIKITCFDQDLAALAAKINEHTDIQRSLGVEYEQRKEQLNTVISGISHDFRTPLTASLGYLQMIEKSGGLSAQQQEYLTIAMQKNRYLKELSDEFFALTKLENGKDELQPASVNLSNVLTEALLEQHSWIEERNITAELAVTEGIVIEADPHCLHRILDNLLSNARKYTDDRLTVTLTRENGQVQLCVQNTLQDGGAVEISRVFEPFYRMDARTAGGSGLGLYVVKLLCDRLGWSVTAELPEEKVFCITLTI